MDGGSVVKALREIKSLPYHGLASATHYRTRACMGSTNNYGRLLGQFEQFEADIAQVEVEEGFGVSVGESRDP
jgi:hypothetical protein